MKKISSLIVTVFVVSIMNVQAQGIEVGIKGGLTIPKIGSGGTDTPLSEGYSSIMAWGGGAFVDFQITKTFSIQTGLEYIQEGGQKNGVQALPAQKIYAATRFMNPAFADLEQFLPSDYIYADFKSVAHFNYLMLPVQAKFGWDLSQNSLFRFYASGGIFASYLLSAEQVSKGTFPPFYADTDKGSLSAWAAAHTPGFDMLPAMQQAMIRDGIDDFATTPRSVDSKDPITPDLRRINFGFIAAIGLSYQIAPKHKVLIEAGGNYGLIKLQKNPLLNGENCIGAASIMLGYAVGI